MTEAHLTITTNLWVDGHDQGAQHQAVIAIPDTHSTTLADFSEWQLATELLDRISRRTAAD